MAVELWSKSGSSSTVVSTGGIPATDTTTVTVQNPLTAANGIYIPSGGTSSVVDNYQIITFTGTGSFTCNQTGNVEMMLIGGGGGGSNQLGSAHAGASSGGMIYYGSNLWRFRSGTSITLVAGTTYTITIGAGGALGQPTNITTLTTAMGGNTSIVGGSISLTAYGGSSLCGDYNAGGAGSRYYNKTTAQDSSYTFAAPNQGYPGGTKSGRQDYHFLGAGGGGTGEGGGHGYGGGNAGYDTLVYNSGWGGNGFLTDISGTTAYYGGGGGGGAFSYNGISGGPGKPGGLGGGGAGGYLTAVSYPGVTGGAGTNGTLNTGGGGGGACYSYGTGYSGGFSGGQGGSGVIIMKIPLYSTISIGNIANISTTGATVTTNGDYKTATFTGSGSFTVVNSQTNAVVEYLVVAGGGGGGYNSAATAGSGGGGGFLEWTLGTTPGADFVGPKLAVNTGETYTVSVGGGGAVGISDFSSTAGYSAQIGGNTVISCTSSVNSAFYVKAHGGGAGGYGGGDNSNTPGKYNGGSGGSGGGVGHGGTGREVPGMEVLSPRQGYSGSNDMRGLTIIGVGATYYGGGAGGPPPSAYAAGPGRASVITGSTYSAGGYTGAGGANTGNGGTGFSPSGAGGSGIAAIRWKFQ